jgi:adenylate cyclase
LLHDVEENLGLDVLFELRGPVKVPTDVLIVSMDRASADQLELPPEPEKWPRSLHARLTRTLAEGGAAVIAFDMIFDEPAPAEDDALFAEAIDQAGNVILCEYLEKVMHPLANSNGMHKGELSIERVVPPIAPLAESAAALTPFPLPKVPVKVSQFWTFKTGAGDIPTLPVVILQVFALDVYDQFIGLMKTAAPNALGGLPKNRELAIARKGMDQISLRLREIFNKNPSLAKNMLDTLNSIGHALPTNKKQTLLALIKMYQGPDSRFLNFYGPPGTIPTIPYYQFVQRKQNRIVSDGIVDFKGKAVLIGVSEQMRPEQKDGFHTVFSKASGIDISGVEIAATAFANLHENLLVRPLNSPLSLAVVFCWGLILGFLCLVLPTLMASSAVVAICALYMITAQYQFNTAGAWFPLVVPLLIQAPLSLFGSVLWRYIDTNKERQNIRKAFGYYLPDRVVNELTENMGDVKASGQVVYGTCLFTDAERYTSVSEKIAPSELHNFVNNYFETLFGPVMQHGGIVADVKGDGMLAIWATSRPDASIRDAACTAALDIFDRVDRFNEASPALQLPTRIGLHSGYVFLGNIGAMNHYEYRPVGDIVNTASRIEALNKCLRTQILLSEDVVHDLDCFVTRELGRFLFAGKSNPIVIHELLGRIEGCNEQQRSLCSVFADALTAYSRQMWDEAIEAFSESQKIKQGDGPSAYYLNLCQNFRMNPPGESWNGLVSLNNK